MANQFSSKNTFKFVNTLYKKAKVKAYRDMLARHQVASKHEFIRRTVDNTLKSTQYWMIGYSDKLARIERANELWKCGVECHALRHFSPEDLKLSSFKRLDWNSGLLAILKEMFVYGRNFDWAEIVKGANYIKVKSAWENYNIEHTGWAKFKTLNAYASNYYTSYRSWLHKIGAIQPAGRKGLWKLTQFGHDVAEELMAWYDKKSLK